MEVVDCPLCASPARISVFSVLDNNWLKPGEFCLVRCLDCGMVYVTPRPDMIEIKEFYPAAYYKRSILVKQPGFNRKLIDNSFAQRLSWIRNFKKEGRVLELGCGDGLFLKYLKERGYNVFGVDISEVAILAAKENLGADFVTMANLQDLKLEENSFDVICCFEVLEHLHKPKDVLKECMRILKNDGVLFASVPNFDSLERKIFGRVWNGIDAPRHLLHFNGKTLYKMVCGCGFLDCRVFDVASHLVNDVGIISAYSDGVRQYLRKLGLYLAKSSAISNIGNRPQRLCLLKSIVHFLEKIVFYPLLFMAKIFKRQATLILIAKK